MLTLPTIRARLAERHPMEVAAAAGVHHNTVRLIRDNPNCNPKYRVLVALSRVLALPGEQVE